MEGVVAAGGLVAALFGGVVYRLSYMGDDLSTGGHSDSISFSHFKKQAKTGDLILTSGAALTSVSRMVTESIWSHCGMLYIDKETGMFYEWSSHNKDEGVENSMHTPWNGAQLVPLDYLVSDNGFIHWRPIQLEDSQREKIYQIVEKLKYTVGFSQIPEFLAYFGPYMAKLFSGFGTGLVCSHLVALTYISIEALALDRQLSLFAPADFADTGNATWLVPVESRLKMVVGYDTSRLISLFHTTAKVNKERGIENKK
jgi:hypothetical protein